MYRVESLGSVVQSVGFKGLGLGLRMQPCTLSLNAKP